MTGNEVERQTAHNGIKRARLLAFHYENEQIVGIAAIKQPTNNYKQNVFLKSQVNDEAPKYSLELGYIVTLKKYRGQGICSKLVGQLLGAVTENVYATTRENNDSMQRILEDRGFQKIGNQYKGQRHGKDYNLQLFVR